MDKINFTGTLTIVAEALGHKLTPPQVEAYYFALNNKFTDESFREAALGLLQSWNYGYFPKPAHFLESSKLNDDELMIAANEAWANVIEAIRGGAGYTKRAQFGDSLTEHAVNSVGGMSKLCALTKDDLDWKKKDFLNIFKAGYKTGKIASISNEQLELLDDAKDIVIPAAVEFKQEVTAIEHKSNRVNNLVAAAAKALKA